MRRPAISKCIAIIFMSIIAVSCSKKPEVPPRSVEQLIGSSWQQNGRAGSFKVTSNNVGGHDGCNSHGSRGLPGEEAENFFVFGSDGAIKVGKSWRFSSTKKSCDPYPQGLALPSSDWKSYQLNGDSLEIMTTKGDHLIYQRAATDGP
jgi:hypothetical protein